ncbi:TIR domain-containing protein [Sinorhizobium medicae]|nr:TIR domain-containing protein [Sinorhizobium medicae]MDX0842396.1 TIR domain-containing protein [Sinorhizobium medicae]
MSCADGEGAALANIFISYSNRDREYVKILANMLREHGQIVRSDLDLVAGTDWRAQLTEGLTGADVFIVILSENSLQSAYPMAELGRALAMAETGAMLIIPILIDESPIPTLLQDVLVLRASNRAPESYFPEIMAAISAFEERRDRRTLHFEEVERDIAEFVEEAIKQQKEYEKTNKKWALFWQFSGVVALLAVMIAGGVSLYFATQRVATAPDSAGVFALGSIIVFNIVTVGVLAALARYSYSLAKSYMSESLKSSDRIHAIQFGKFFVRAFGTRLTPAEVKDAFQHWNIDRTSTFSSLDSAQIDPQIYSLIVQLVGALKGKKE